MKAHAAAKLFPELPKDQMAALVRDIKERGQLTPIVMFKGQVLDGRNRVRACKQLGIEPKTRTLNKLPGDHTPETYVVSQNLHRRHLTLEQRGFIAVELKKRLQAGERRGRPKKGGTDATISGNGSAVGKSREVAAEALGIGARTVDHAERVLDKGTPELQLAVRAGEVPMSTAAKLADLSPVKQKNALAGGAAAVREAVQPKADPNHVSKAFWRMIENVHAVINYVWQTHGTVAEMMQGKHWDHSEDEGLADYLEGLHQTLGQMVKDARKHERTTARRRGNR